MSDSINPNQRSRSSRMNNATHSESPNGKHQPLGKIIDTWRRIEFQLRGTPHSHGMACVINDGTLAESLDETD